MEFILLAGGLLALLGLGGRGSSTPRKVRVPGTANFTPDWQGPMPAEFYQLGEQIKKGYGADFAKAGMDPNAFVERVLTTSYQLGMDPRDMMNVMFFESGAGQVGPPFNPKAVNPSSGASGIIQFMPSTAAKLLFPEEYAEAAKLDRQKGTRWKHRRPVMDKAIAIVRGMNGLQQLDLAGLYFAKVANGEWDDKQRGPLDSTQAVFMAVFYPWARYWGPGQQFPENVQKANKHPRTGVITLRTPADYIRKVMRVAKVQKDEPGRSQAMA